jgi:hypothetical protein
MNLTRTETALILALCIAALTAGIVCAMLGRGG